jgi:hypothetical protein
VSKIIAPTVGRQVWLQGTPTDPWNRNPDVKPYVAPGQPMAATVVAVWNDRLVNLDVIDHVGVHWFMSSVTLVQPGDELPGAGVYAQWMPYQVGQANKEVSIADAFERLTKAMQEDPEYAWGWHCNVTMPIFDSAVWAAHEKSNHEASNLAAARVMQHLFGVDTSKHPHFAPTVYEARDTVGQLAPAEELQEEQPEPLNLCPSCETCSHCLKAGCVDKTPVTIADLRYTPGDTIQTQATEPADVGTRETSNV